MRSGIAGEVITVVFLVTLAGFYTTNRLEDTLSFVLGALMTVFALQDF